MFSFIRGLPTLHCKVRQGNMHDSLVNYILLYSPLSFVCWLSDGQLDHSLLFFFSFKTSLYLHIPAGMQSIYCWNVCIARRWTPYVSTNYTIHSRNYNFLNFLNLLYVKWKQTFGMADKESSTCARRLFRTSGCETENPTGHIWIAAWYLLSRVQTQMRTAYKDL